MNLLFYFHCRRHQITFVHPKIQPDNYAKLATFSDPNLDRSLHPKFKPDPSLWATDTLGPAFALTPLAIHKWNKGSFVCCLLTNHWDLITTNSSTSFHLFLARLNYLLLGFNHHSLVHYSLHAALIHKSSASTCFDVFCLFVF